MKFDFKSKKKIVLAGFILVLIVATITGISLSNSKSEKLAKAYPETVTNSSDNPDESAITDENYVWKGKDSEPKKIILKTIGAQGYIQKVGIDQRKEVGVPSNINLAGWFTKMSIPGQKGLSVIDGHVDGISKPGIFKKLDKLKTGSVFEIEYGSGDKKKFKVTSKTTVAKEDAPAVLFSQDPTVTSQLNLITCGGDYDRKARHYNDRVIITSVPI